MGRCEGQFFQSGKERVGGVSSVKCDVFSLSSDVCNAM